MTNKEVTIVPVSVPNVPNWNYVPPPPQGACPACGYSVKTIREVVLTPDQIERAILRFEQKYGFHSTEFVGNPELQLKVSENDVFEWKVMIADRDAQLMVSAIWNHQPKPDDPPNTDLRSGFLRYPR